MNEQIVRQTEMKGCRNIAMKLVCLCLWLIR
jgi:hypothetical protein